MFELFHLTDRHHPHRRTLHYHPLPPLLERWIVEFLGVRGLSAPPPASNGSIVILGQWGGDSRSLLCIEIKQKSQPIFYSCQSSSPWRAYPAFSKMPFQLALILSTWCIKCMQGSWLCKCITSAGHIETRQTSNDKISMTIPHT